MRGDLSQFFLCVVDADQGIFSVEGPMKDDQVWRQAISEAQSSGRAVRCFSVPRWGNRKAVERHYAALSSLQVREPGGIVAPDLNLDQQTDVNAPYKPPKRKLK